MIDIHKRCVAAQEWHIARNVALEQKLRVAREALEKARSEIIEDVTGNYKKAINIITEAMDQTK